MRTESWSKRRNTIWLQGAVLMTLALRAPALSNGQLNSAPGGSATADPTVLREIVDPSTGHHWLLLRDQARPGAPGRLVLAATPHGMSPGDSLARLVVPVLPSARLQPIIRGGDRVMVEETTPVVEAHLEGVALQPAAEGAQLDVRLKLSGTRVRAVALAPGRVEIVRLEGGKG